MRGGGPSSVGFWFWFCVFLRLMLGAVEREDEVLSLECGVEEARRAGSMRRSAVVSLEEGCVDSREAGRVDRSLSSLWGARQYCLSRVTGVG